MSDPRLRVLVVSQRRPRAFCAALEAAGVEVCAVVDDAAGAVDTAPHAHPDACVVDADAARDGDALATLTAVASGVPVVLAGAHPTDGELVDAFKAGASGYLAGDIPDGRLEPILRDAVSGRSAFPRRLDSILLAAMRGATSADRGGE